MAKTWGSGYREWSGVTERHIDEDQGPPYEIIADEILTRRKKFHLILDSEGGVVWRSKWFVDCLIWLEERGEKAYTLRAAGRSWSCTFVR